MVRRDGVDQGKVMLVFVITWFMLNTNYAMPEEFKVAIINNNRNLHYLLYPIQIYQQHYACSSYYAYLTIISPL